MNNTAPYGWIIDKDFIASPDAREPSNANARGMIGPSNIAPEILARLRAGEGDSFRMKDDDGELYYEGRLLDMDPGSNGFGPLDDFGTPNAGAAGIEYREGKKWTLL